ncbi:MAG TPA: sialidase family protein [Chitinophagaceae bacterium]|nr:sialidase family protein [Chitinophagaceae bacterium]
MDRSGNPQLVFGNGDSILYSSSADGGKTFSSSALVAVVPKLAASHMRGPQIAATANGLLVTACTDLGDIFSFIRDGSGNWSKTGRVNDVDTMAKENLMALAADGDKAFAVWLDLRDGHNKIFGARSSDGGKTWSKNMLVYASPDTTVCECCKPSVVVKGDNIYIMFRNQLNGNRDLYLVQSSDGGTNFGEAKKLGLGSWSLNGCPMDGGGLALAKDGNIETVFNRQGVIYSCEPGNEEKELGRGRSCTMESVNGKNVYAWVEEGNVVIVKPRGMKKNLGKGQLPLVKALNNEHVLCIWENDKKIHREILEL